MLTQAGSCPRCEAATVRDGKGEPWCPQCEWNLFVYDPPHRQARGWRWFDRVGNRIARRFDEATFRAFADQPPSRPGWTSARIVLTAVSITFMALVLTCLLGGIALIIAHASVPWTALGVLLAGVALLLRPSLGRRVPEKRRLKPTQAAGLRSLVARVAEHVGTPPPDDIVLDFDYNASFARLGLQRRRTLTIGLPLWVTLTPQARIALLAHELGHDVNGDPERGALVWPAMEAFGRIADWTGAERGLGYVFHPDRGAPSGPQLIGELAMWLISRPFLFAYLGLSAIGLRDHQRAEYLADLRATDIAGTDGSAKLTQALVLDRAVMTIVGYAAETHPPEQWRELVENFVQHNPDAMRQYGQLSRRQTTLWDSHPPSGLRASIVQQWPRQEGKLILHDKASQQVDTELAPWYAAMHKKFLGTRQYRKPRASTTDE